MLIVFDYTHYVRVERTRSNARPGTTELPPHCTIEMCEGRILARNLLAIKPPHKEFTRARGHFNIEAFPRRRSKNLVKE